MLVLSSRVETIVKQSEISVLNGRCLYKNKNYLILSSLPDFWLGFQLKLYVHCEKNKKRLGFASLLEHVDYKTSWIYGF